MDSIKSLWENIVCLQSQHIRTSILTCPFAGAVGFSLAGIAVAVLGSVSCPGIMNMVLTVRYVQADLA